MSFHFGRVGKVRIEFRRCSVEDGVCVRVNSYHDVL